MYDQEEMDQPWYLLLPSQGIWQADASTMGEGEGGGVGRHIECRQHGGSVCARGKGYVSKALRQLCVATQRDVHLVGTTPTVTAVAW